MTNTFYLVTHKKKCVIYQLIQVRILVFNWGICLEFCQIFSAICLYTKHSFLFFEKYPECWYQRTKVQMLMEDTFTQNYPIICFICPYTEKKSYWENSTILISITNFICPFNRFNKLCTLPISSISSFICLYSENNYFIFY